MVGVKFFFSKWWVTSMVLIFPGKQRWTAFSGGPLILIRGLICGRGIIGHSQRVSPILKTFHAGRSTGACLSSLRACSSSLREEAGPPAPHPNHLASVYWPWGLKLDLLILLIPCLTAARTDYLKRGLVGPSGVPPIHMAVPPLPNQHFTSSKMNFWTSQCTSQ